MRRSFITLTAAALVAASLYGQSQTPGEVGSRSEETLEWWNQIGRKLIAMAKDFPEDRYDFRVQKDERTFGQNLAHVAAVDYDLIGKVAGSHIGPDFGQAQPAGRCLQDEGRNCEADRAGRRRRRGGNQTAGRYGTGQDDAIQLGNREPCGP